MPSHPYLHPPDLAPLRRLPFSPRGRVGGRRLGAHPSRKRGRGVEFNDYRAYTPGDNPADIDWKAFARTDRLFIKRFEHTAQMSVHLLIDASASMAYAGAPVDPSPASEGDSKYDHACRLAAALAFLLMEQRDRVGLSMARDALTHFHRAHDTMRRLDAMLSAMQRTHPQGQAQLGDTLRQLLPMIPRRGLLVVLSDLLDEPDAILRELTHYTHRGGEVALLHVLHADELRLPSLGPARFIDSETGQQLTAETDRLREGYPRRIRQFLDTWSAAARSRGLDYLLARADEPYVRTLQRWLRKRT